MSGGLGYVHHKERAHGLSNKCHPPTLETGAILYKRERERAMRRGAAINGDLGCDSAAVRRRRRNG